MNNAFRDMTNFNELLLWNTQNVTIMTSIFKGANKFNKPLNFITTKFLHLVKCFVMLNLSINL